MIGERCALAADRFFAALTAAGMPPVPGDFSVVPHQQSIPATTLDDIAHFIRVFDQVTTRQAWQAAVRRDAPAIAQLSRAETCFFSAWDFHLPSAGGCWLIEFNDNGSGFLFAAMINALYYEMADPDERRSVAAPSDIRAFTAHLIDMAIGEATEFFNGQPDGLFLVLDDADTLQTGKFRRELELLCDLFRSQGWQAELGSPAEAR